MSLASPFLIASGLLGAAVVGKVAYTAIGNSSAKSVSGGIKASKFYKGGFDAKLTKREAALILGVRENISKEKLKDAHRKIMLLNHPDRGGSPYIATKINEAKELLDKTAR
ncbi:hypothetical protein PIROE2DRAFT_8401 [Piromyces sp. E2]|nr:hypothetical protein PIROE2DRAFT_8401 [Piromyces sp. E2]|eukprot:OUM64717.1 hypothetical protein PIROE2DRAFT_8401 [Piromyces sp. E2]